MKHIGAMVLVLFLGGVLYGTQRPSHTGQGRLQKQSPRSAELERAIEMIFSRCVTRGEAFDRKKKVEALGSKEEVTAVLRKMMAQHRYAREGSLRLIYLNGATWMLGEFGDKEAEPGLSSLVFDRRVHENVRAQAVKSLGDIDPESNRDLLLRALHSDKSQNHMIRVYAAEGLARVRGPLSTAALERAARHESDLYVREKFLAAAQQARSMH